MSGATDYKALCLAAKAEEKRWAELKKRRQYRSDTRTSQPGMTQSARSENYQMPQTNPQSGGGPSNRRGQFPTTGRCWNCRKTGHVAAECRAPRPGSPASGGNSPATGPPRAQQVQTSCDSLADSPDPGTQPNSSATQPSNATATVAVSDPFQYLFPDSDEEAIVRITQIQVRDKGSSPQRVRVVVAGVPVDGVVDTGADITIVGGEAFKRIAAVARLRRRDVRPADKTPHTYDQKTFRIDGRVELDITFQGRSMKTPIYVKMDAKEELLLSEGVCRQLGIVSYHNVVTPGQSREAEKSVVGEVSVPAVRVQLVQMVKLKPEESVWVEVKLVGDGVGGEGPLLGDGVNRDEVASEMPTQLMLLESDRPQQMGVGAQIPGTLVQPSVDGFAKVLLTNCHSLTHRIKGGTDIGYAVPVEVVEPELQTEISNGGQPQVNTVTNTGTVASHDKHRQKLLVALLQDELDNIPEQERTQLTTMLEKYHEVFSLVEGERGETDLTEIHIETGDATPKKQPVRRVPFAVRREVARQLQHMQEDGVIQPSSSPWASAIVLVRKKDGSLRICVDYRRLNSVTKPDTFPLPRIDDLLDQLGSAEYFTTLDLAAGYWQIRVADDSIEKTAFVTPNGLFEFRVMPFGLTNAPAIFQRLMQRVLSGLNPAEGPDYVAVYIDDILIFSRTMEEHLHHISRVLDRLRAAGLKLRPTKCHFLCQRVEYLGHLITPHGLGPNPKRVSAVADFPVPASVTQVRQFVGLTSYYRRFIKNFAKTAAPLHNLTRKDVEFCWTVQCQDAFDALKRRLTEAPVLVYPNFNFGFILETDASYQGLGAVLSQRLEDQKLHPVAFGSRALAPTEKNYAVTELETLAVVWAVKHFRAYLYGHDVQVVTDHSAVKALLATPSPSGKHARWWLQVYGSGARKVDVVYRPGNENTRADALSRNPVSPNTLEPHGLDVQVAAVCTADADITQLLESPPGEESLSDFHMEQQLDSELKHLYQCLKYGLLPAEEQEARTIAARALHFTIIDDVLYFLDTKRGGRRRAAVPSHLQKSILEDYHCGKMAGHFSGARLYTTLSRQWWWRTMYKDAIEFSRSCGECATVTGVGRRCKPPLHPIPVQRPFQIIGVDVMELPVTEQGNRYVIVFQDFMTKWPLVFPAPDQKAIRLARLVAEELLPLFGVPDAILSDRGANLLAHVMQDVCQLLGVTKLNTTSYHPQCDGMVERLNRTLKTMLRKHVARFGGQWDRFLPGVLWAYRNTPHESTKEKPSFLLFGIDLKSPTEASLLPPDPLNPTDLGSYREELVLSLSSARELAVASIREAQRSYKGQYDKGTKITDYKIGDWVFVRFPQEETGRRRKLSRPWYGPFRVVSRKDPNLGVSKVYFPEDAMLLVHQLRVCRSPDMLPPGFYWYGAKRRSSGHTPKWLQRMLASASEGSGKEDHQEGADEEQQSESIEPQSDGQSATAEEPPTTLCDFADHIDSCKPLQDGDAFGMAVNGETHSSSADGSKDQDFQRLEESANGALTPTQSVDGDMGTTPFTTRYALRDRLQRQPPQWLMSVASCDTVRDELTRRRGVM